ncbi:MAG: hypothetical protein RLZZ585_1343, partial [Bacteroidota bacterium]
MLSSESIHQQMRNTSSCSTRHLNELKELMDLYPFASSIVTLYLKSLANDQDLRLSSQLEKYAYQIPNRTLLYDLLVTQTNVSKDEVAAQPEIIQEVLAEIPLEEKTIEVEQIASITSISAEAIPVEKIEEPKFSEEETEELETLIEPVSKTEVLSAQELKIEEEVLYEGEEESSLNIPHQIEEARELDEVDTMIQSAVISSSYLQLAYPGAAEEMETEENTPVEESPDEEVVLETIQVLEPSATIEPKSFTDWLKMGEILDGNNEEPAPEEKKPSFYHFEKPKKEFFSPVKKAKESLDENKMPVSETLAQVFALQGNINKAILVYEQLILIFPEKKSFFASQ